MNFPSHSGCACLSIPEEHNNCAIVVCNTTTKSKLAHPTDTPEHEKITFVVHLRLNSQMTWAFPVRGDRLHPSQAFSGPGLRER